jgi:hypothetical protein
MTDIQNWVVYNLELNIGNDMESWGLVILGDW